MDWYADGGVVLEQVSLPNHAAITASSIIRKLNYKEELLRLRETGRVDQLRTL